MSSHEADCKLESQISLPHSAFQKNKCLYEVYKKDNDFNASLFLIGKKLWVLCKFGYNASLLTYFQYKWNTLLYITLAYKS